MTARYDFYIKYDDDLGDSVEMRRDDEHGEFVRYSDYRALGDKLQRCLERLKAK